MTLEKNVDTLIEKWDSEIEKINSEKSNLDRDKDAEYWLLLGRADALGCAIVDLIEEYATTNVLNEYQEKNLLIYKVGCYPPQKKSPMNAQTIEDILNQAKIDKNGRIINKTWLIDQLHAAHTKAKQSFSLAGLCHLPGEILGFVEDYCAYVANLHGYVRFCAPNFSTYQQAKTQIKNVDLWIEAHIDLFPELQEFRNLVRQNMENLKVEPYPDFVYQRRNHFALKDAEVEKLKNAIEQAKTLKTNKCQNLIKGNSN